MDAAGGGGRIWTFLEAELQREILGQSEATSAFARAVLRGEMNYLEPERPRSFSLLLGETGVGKTETVLATARLLTGGVDTVIRLDMAEFAERGPGLARLVGSGAADPGLLGVWLARARQARREAKRSVFLLLDEIEKAHPDITRLFLGMEAARLTLADGQQLDLADVHIVATSNLGSEAARQLRGGVPAATIRRVVEEEARAHFGSAVLARFGDVIVYQSLDYTVQRAICRQKLERKCRYLGERLGRAIALDEDVVEHVMRRGWHRDLGARNLRHTVDRELGDAAVRYSLQARHSAEGALRLRLAVDRVEFVPAGGAVSDFTQQ